MKTVLQEPSLDWALTHLCRYCDSDFFPRIFEFDAIQENWEEVKLHILSISIEQHVPKPPLVRFAPKLRGGYRVVHRLDPVDSLIYTAMVYEVHRSLEGPRDSRPERIVSSFRADPAAGGSFFNTGRDTWQQHVGRVEELVEKYQDGYVLMTDIYDFFRQIQPRRVGRILTESSSTRADLASSLSHFLSSLLLGSARGIPVGPAASTVLAEAVLGSIDRKIQDYSSDFVRWGDDMRVFFRTQKEADDAMHELAAHIHTAHELILAPEKTKVVPVGLFKESYFLGLPQETVAAGSAEVRLNEVLGRVIVPHNYGWMTSAVTGPEPMSVYAQIQTLPEFQTAGNAYLVQFNKAVSSNPPDLMDAKRIMRKAAAYRIRTLLPGVLEHFDRLSPVIREAATYLKAVLDEENIRKHAVQLRNAWENKLLWGAYANDWMCHAITNPGLNQIDLPANYNAVIGVRNQALVARRKQDADWVRKQAAHIEGLNPWDRRAVLYASLVLPQSERESVAQKALARGEIVERSIIRHLESISTRCMSTVKFPYNYPSYGDKAAAKTPDNYPSYGDKPQAKAPDNYPSYGDKSQATAPDNTKLDEQIQELMHRISDQAKTIREQQAAISELKSALDQNNAGITSLNARILVLEQIKERLMKQEQRQNN